MFCSQRLRILNNIIMKRKENIVEEFSKLPEKKGKKTNKKLIKTKM